MTERSGDERDNPSLERRRKATEEKNRSQDGKYLADDIGTTLIIDGFNPKSEGGLMSGAHKI